MVSARKVSEPFSFYADIRTGLNPDSLPKQRRTLVDYEPVARLSRVRPEPVMSPPRATARTYGIRFLGSERNPRATRQGFRGTSPTPVCPERPARGTALNDTQHEDVKRRREAQSRRPLAATSLKPGERPRTAVRVPEQLPFLFPWLAAVRDWKPGPSQS